MDPQSEVRLRRWLERMIRLARETGRGVEGGFGPTRDGRVKELWVRVEREYVEVDEKSVDGATG
jgi:hypothetical protein